MPVNESLWTAAAGRSRNLTGFAVFLLTLAIPAFASPVYDAAADFSVAANPNGQWSYLVSGSLLTQGQSTCNGHTGIACWDNDSSIPTYTSVSDNLTGSPISENGTVDLPPGELNLDPEANIVTVVWTAPSSGMWSISGFFSGLDTVSASHPAEVILDSSTTLFSTTIAGYGDLADFSFDRYLSAGDTLDFEVGTGNGGYFLGTGFDATISAASTSAVPEPGGLALFGSGLLLLAGFARGRQTNRGAKD
jgi:hypothetical protein